jgi:cytochrome c peroxidase
MMFEWVKMVFGCGCVLAAASAFGVFETPAGAGAVNSAASSEVPQGRSRNAVWRQIFARPAPANETTAADETDVSPGMMSARVQLGARLFFDTRLSADNDRACASCHQPALGFSDGRRKALGRDGSELDRHVPALYNLAAAPHFFWDGRAAGLEEQAHTPLTARNELAGDYETIASRLARDDEVRDLFKRAFSGPAGIDRTTITRALAAYERTIVSPRSRFDEWVDGDDAALNRQEKMGFGLFVGKAGCVSCHGGWRFTDDRLHDVGLKGSDQPVGNIPDGGVPLRKRFKTPGLRNIRITAPYMHDGSLATLAAVVDHYSRGLNERPTLAPQLVRGLQLSDAERQALVAFLETL